MATTLIEWTDQVWNPTTGCDRISAGCDNCYALTMAKRLKGMGSAKYQTDGDPRTSGPGFGLAIHEDSLNDPFTWRKPRKVFVNSMSDLFHAKVPVEFIRRVFEVIEATPQHTYQVLTKRASRLPKLADKLPWPSNLWMGVSVENQQAARQRIWPLLRALHGRQSLPWISAEPLLGPLDLSEWMESCALCEGWGEWHLPLHVAVASPMDRYLGRCDGCGGRGGWWPGWVVVGGESGRGARPLDPAWARAIVKQCQDAEVPVFVKQFGSVWAKNQSGDRKGGNWDHWPADLRVREFPEVPSLVPEG